MVRIYSLYVVVFVLIFLSMASSLRIIYDSDGVADFSSVKAECQKLFYSSPHILNTFNTTRGPPDTLIDVAILKSGHVVQEGTEIVLKSVCRSLHPGVMEVAWGKEYNNVERTQEYQWNPVNGSMRQMFNLSIILKIYVATTEHIRVTCIKNLTSSSLENIPATFSLLLSKEDYKGESEMRMKLDLVQEADMKENANDTQTSTFCSHMPANRLNPFSEIKDLLIVILLFTLVASIPIYFLIWAIPRYIRLEQARRNRQRQL